MAGDGLELCERQSPNQGPRRDDARPDMVVLHYTGMETGRAAIDRLCDPAAEVSAHYLIEPGGRVWALVEETARAWHAGVSSWGGIEDVNSRSIGIEIVNPGHALGYPPFPEPQMSALEVLLKGVLARWRIVPERVLGHACVAPGRKRDPGEKFDWRRLARRGLAIWPEAARDPSVIGAEAPVPDATRFQAAAASFGYGLARSGAWDAQTLAVLSAFRQRFRPPAMGHPPEGDDLACLTQLAARYPARPACLPPASPAAR